jgi:hypothetical protein
MIVLVSASSLLDETPGAGARGHDVTVTLYLTALGAATDLGATDLDATAVGFTR